jgi:uncharacterized protein (TIGR00297 family)
VFGFGGLNAAAILVFFFVSSSALSALSGGNERSRRGARQVLANGSVAALAAVMIPFHPLAGLGFLGALAAATADTWATEIGVRSGARPRSILTFEVQEPGTSGAISLPGTVGSAVGACAVGAAGAWLLGEGGLRCAFVVAISGLAGSLFDSLLGAGPQAGYRCPECGSSPEVARHADCPATAERISGLPGLDNDAVNFLATQVGALLCVIGGALW